MSCCLMSSKVLILLTNQSIETKKVKNLFVCSFITKIFACYKYTTYVCRWKFYATV